MPRADFRTPRLFVNAPLEAGAVVPLDASQANYLVNALRMTPGAAVLAFNGRDGEWRTALRASGRKTHTLAVEELIRPQPPVPDLQYLFAPLKQARLDYMVEKAVEMGVGRLRPVLTQHGQVTRINRDRLTANAIEAAEQCGVLSIPSIDQPAPLRVVVEAWPEQETGRRIIFCDEDAESADPLVVLSSIEPSPLALLVGPEGGFSRDEREFLRSKPLVTAISLGPRILRADTAAVAALAIVQAALGDWRRN